MREGRSLVAVGVPDPLGAHSEIVNGNVWMAIVSSSAGRFLDFERIVARFQETFGQQQGKCPHSVEALGVGVHEKRLTLLQKLDSVSISLWSDGHQEGQNDLLLSPVDLDVDLLGAASSLGVESLRRRQQRGRFELAQALGHARRAQKADIGWIEQ
jgi:hypothetical protein